MYNHQQQFQINKFFLINNEITHYQDCINSKETYKRNSMRSETTLKEKRFCLPQKHKITTNSLTDNPTPLASV